MASEVAEDILKYIEEHGELETIEFANKKGVDHNVVVGAVKSLQAAGDVISAEPVNNKIWELTDEGKHVVECGSHEMQVYKFVPPEGIPLSKLMELLHDKMIASVGFNKAMSAGWLKIDKSACPMVLQKCTPEVDIVQRHLQLIMGGKGEDIDLPQKLEYKKRKLLQEIVKVSYLVKKGKNFTTQISKAANDLTVDMLANDIWKTLEFKPYNFNALGAPPPCGYLHPLLKVRTQIRQIFLEMGFSEMPTNNYIESSFWNFDALFQPQQHPARDAHDTFFISDPALSDNFPEDYMERVKQVHSVGGYGSQGYGYDWSIGEAKKNLLRTHTTAVSARMLYKLAQEGFRPVKYFSIDRVFRNETLDATHLAEFQQVEGVVADYNLTLGNLIGILSEFFRKLGMEQLHFKPAYNPYTEPSMEIFSYHAGLGKWIEVGNSGMFRPEMLLPMGLPQDVNVIAWGLSLERPTMIKYGLNNIRDLVGPRVDLKMVQENPICRLEKGGTSLEDVICAMERRWESILTQLDSLSTEVKYLRGQSDNTSTVSISKTSSVVFANPQCPPHSLIILFKLLSAVCSVSISFHVHSSVENLPTYSRDYVLAVGNKNEEDAVVNVTFVWKNVTDVTLVKAPVNHVNIIGEVNVLRYFCRLIEELPSDILLYEKFGLLESSLIDSWLDHIQLTLSKEHKKQSSGLIQTLCRQLENTRWLVGNSPSAADIALWSAIKQSELLNSCILLKKWSENCREHSWFCSTSA